MTYTVRAKSLLRHMSWLDMVMLFAWVLSTALPLTWAQPLRFLGAAYFCASMILFAPQTMPTAVRALPAFILPVMCLISATWAPAPSDAIRKGILLALTAIPAIYAASRLSGRQILLVFFLVETIAAIMTVIKPNPVGGAWTGMFGQKNFLAVNIFILFACAMALTLDKGSNRWIRLAALAMLPVSVFTILMAKSATTTLLLLGAGAAMLGHSFLWKPAARIRHMRILLLLGVATLAIGAVLLLFGLMQFDAMGELLDALGKDSTLTGRTYLWQTAERVMADNPLTGVGAEGFWRPEFGAANSITEYFFYDRYVRFSFHSSYLENGVSFGYPGYWATVFIAVWAIARTFLNWARNQTIINGAFLVLAVMIIIRSTAEIDLAQEFAGTAVLLFIGALRWEKLDPKPSPPRPATSLIPRAPTPRQAHRDPA